MATRAPATPDMRRATSFQMRHHDTPRHTLRKGMSDRELLGDDAIRAITDFDKCIVERNTRTHFDWSTRWHCHLNAGQQRIIAAHQAYLATLPRVSERILPAPSAPTSSLESLLEMQAQAKRLLHNSFGSTDHCVRLADVIHQVRRSMYYALCKQAPGLFAVITEICNNDSGPIGKAILSEIEKLCKEFPDDSIVVDPDKYQILIKHNDTGIDYELMAAFTRRSPELEHCAQTIKLVHVTGTYTKTDRGFELSKQVVCELDYHKKTWDNFEANTNRCRQQWRTMPALIDKLNADERQAVLVRCGSKKMGAPEEKPRTPAEIPMHATLWENAQVNPLASPRKPAAAGTQESKPAMSMGL